MSGPLSTLSRSRSSARNRTPAEGKRVRPIGLTSRSHTMLKSNEDIQEEETSRPWTPPPLYLTESTDFITTPANYDIKINRAVMTLKHLTMDRTQFIEQPGIYMYDIMLFRYLSSVKHCELHRHATESQAKFVELGLVTLFKNLWTDYFNNIKCSKDWTKIPTDSTEAMYHISMALWFISANPTHIQSLFDELCDFLINIVTGDTFKNNNHGNKRCADILKALLGILYQFAKNIEKTRNLIRQDTRLGYLQRILAQKAGFNRNVKGRVLMILALVMNEAEQKNMTLTNSIVDYLLTLLKDCLDQKDHRSPTHNYEAIEILMGLNHLAVSDANAASISDNGGVSLYKTLLASDNELEQEEACKGIWALSFNDMVVRTLLADQQLLSSLQGLTKANNEKLRAAANGCLWTIRDLKSQKQKKAEARKSGHIMISYSWSVQTQAVELKQVLQDHGYRIWMDIENMNGSTLSAMSQAIESSTVVIMLMNERYKDSPACRAEAEYAYKLQKECIPIRMQQGYTPDGWLGMLIGLKSSFDLSSPDQKAEMIEQIIKTLGDRSKGPPIEDEVPEMKHQEPKPNSKIEPLTTLPTILLPSVSWHASKHLQCMSWNDSQVTEWVKAKKLSNHIESLGTVDGSILTELYFMLSTEPKYFHKMLREDLHLSLMNALQLTAAIRSLK